jgi:hypothetical protein|tara:strand:+ start:655 stop:1920 length:1266 start_codon:yes stop_codon:yes gene_type:complete
MAKFTGFLDNLATGALGPKGNLGDFRHASKTFVTDAFRLAPKTKFLFHVFFEINDQPASVLPELKQRHNREIGLLVKAADLPKYSATVDTKKKYNRIKNVQTSISYNPVNISFHDDNLGITSALMEAYYRYYFADGNYGSRPEAYNRQISKTSFGDTTYAGKDRNKYAYGLDNGQNEPFFKSIQISQLTRKTFTTYTLVNPTITDWGHDSVDSADGAGFMENTMTVAYEAVWYDRGAVGVDNPKGFGDPSHYDTTPSPASLLGGGQLGIGGILNAGIGLYDFITNDGSFNSPLEAGLAAANLISNVRNLSSEGIRSEGFGLLKGAIGAAAGIDVSGVSNTFFPKNGGNGGAKDLVLATAAVAGLKAIAQSANNTDAAKESAARIANNKAYQANGGTGGVNGNTANYNSLTTAQQNALKDGT